MVLMRCVWYEKTAVIWESLGDQRMLTENLLTENMTLNFYSAINDNGPTQPMPDLSQ